MLTGFLLCRTSGVPLVSPPGNTIAVCGCLCRIKNRNMNTCDVCKKQMPVTFVVNLQNSAEGRRGLFPMKKIFKILCTAIM